MHDYLDIESTFNERCSEISTIGEILDLYATGSLPKGSDSLYVLSRWLLESRDKLEKTLNECIEMLRLTEKYLPDNAIRADAERMIRENRIMFLVKKHIGEGNV